MLILVRCRSCCACACAGPETGFPCSPQWGAEIPLLLFRTDVVARRSLPPLSCSKVTRSGCCCCCCCCCLEAAVAFVEDGCCAAALLWCSARPRVKPVVVKAIPSHTSPFSCFIAGTNYGQGHQCHIAELQAYCEAKALSVVLSYYYLQLCVDGVPVSCRHLAAPQQCDCNRPRRGLCAGQQKAAL